MKRWVLLAGAAIGLGALFGSLNGCRASMETGGSGGGEARRPNVVLFLVDDLGWQDSSVAFHTERTTWNERYETPHLERLADEGLVFTNAYAAAPVCTPTRTALLTGKHPARSRITNWTLEGDRSGAHETLLPPAWNLNGLSPDPTTPRAACLETLPMLLRQAGYVTLHVGKAHLGSKDSPGADPTALGFDHNVAGHAAGAPGSHLGTLGFSAEHRGGSKVWDVPGLAAYHGEETTLAEALTLETERLLERAVATGKPFFLHLSHYAVHTPIEPDERYVGAYRAQGLDEREARYASMIEGVDASLGRVRRKLERLGVAKDTLFLFLSDNGGLSAHGRGGPRNTHNEPLRSGKGSAYEGGVRVPMVAHWPGVIAAGTRTDTPVISQDVFPTVLAACGVDRGEPSDGLDLAPLLRGGALPARDLHWHYPHQWGAPGPGIEPYSALRRGSWKLVFFYEARGRGRSELYDLAQDLGETYDLSEAEPEKARELRTALGRWLAEVGAQTPVVAATRRALPFPGP